MIRVIIVDDHAMIRRGLRETLVEAGDFDVIGEAEDYGSLRALMRGQRPDVVLLDLNLPGRGGIDVLRALLLDDDRARVVVLTQYPEDQYGIRALKAGAMSYLNKACDPGEIVTALRTVANGRKYVTKEISLALADSIGPHRSEEPHQALSERELQIFRMIATGRKLSAMATALDLSPKTVSVYRSRVLEKLGLRSNAEIAAYAVRHGLID